MAYNNCMASKNETPLLGVYLITGTDELKRQTVLDRLRKRLEKECDLSLNSDTFNGENAEGIDIVSACNTLPFASDIRLVQVNAVDKLKKADTDQVIAYIESPSPTTVLVLVASGVAKNTRLYKAVSKIGKNAIIDCAPIKRNELPARVRAMATTHGIAITPAAANALIDAVGENTVALDSSLAKLALSHVGADPVTDSEVALIVPRSAQAKPWEFIDAFSERNATKCLALRQRLDSTSPHVLLSMCVTRIRELVAAQSLYARGQGSALASYLKVPDWRVRNHARWAKGFTEQELRDALVSSMKAEQAMKSGTDPESAFQDWYLSVVAR